MFNWFKKQKKEDLPIHPEAKYNSCECAVKFYLNACTNKTMKFSVEDFCEAINARMNPVLNKYFCKCLSETRN